MSGDDIAGVGEAGEAARAAGVGRARGAIALPRRDERGEDGRRGLEAEGSGVLGSGGSTHAASMARGGVRSKLTWVKNVRRGRKKMKKVC